MPPSLAIEDPELDALVAAAYDAANGWAQDDDFFLALAVEQGGRVADVGCGTGRLTIALASAGLDVVGVDPNPAFLNIAFAKPGAERVAWVRGTAADLPAGSFDSVVMTSHVAQVFLTEAEWAATLADLKRCLRPGGLLAFDTRDPSAAAWEVWAADPAFSGPCREDLPGGLVREVTTRFLDFVEGVAMFESMAVVSRSGTASAAAVMPGTITSRGRWGLRFPSADDVARSVREAGFGVEAMFGGWRGEPVGHGVGEIAVVARA